MRARRPKIAAARALQRSLPRSNRVAIRDVAVPWLSGGLIVLGYAAFSWRRAKRRHQRLRERERSALEPFSAHLERVSDDVVTELKAEELPANSNAPARRVDLGALFLGRASDALSQFQFGPEWPQARR